MSRGQVVELHLSPPVGFILRQSGSFRRALMDLQPLWERFKVVMSQVEQERFDSEGHGQWQPLAASTIRERVALGFGEGPILQRTRTLADSLIDPNRAARTGPRQMTYGTDVPYAHYHQDGGSIPGRPPQRPILDIRLEDRRALEAAQVGWINEVARLTWGRI